MSTTTHPRDTLYREIAAEADTCLSNSLRTDDFMSDPAVVFRLLNTLVRASIHVFSTADQDRDALVDQIQKINRKIRTAVLAQKKRWEQVSLNCTNAMQNMAFVHNTLKTKGEQSSMREQTEQFIRSDDMKIVAAGYNHETLCQIAIKACDLYETCADSVASNRSTLLAELSQVEKALDAAQANVPHSMQATVHALWNVRRWLLRDVIVDGKKRFFYTQTAYLALAPPRPGASAK